MTSGEIDPVLVRRALIARLVSIGQRIGYGAYLIAMALFAVGFPTGFPTALVTAMVVLLVVGSLVLAPAIVFGYAVKAAMREDRDKGHPDAPR